MSNAYTKSSQDLQRPGVSLHGSTEVAADFDLNVESVLDGWDVSHAVRELLANALDEQALTDTKPVEVQRIAEGHWHIRDFGRGIRYGHLTQNEDAEKQARESEVIGRFGVGLKDALAVLDRRGVGIELCSAHCTISLTHRAKTGFADVITLHGHVMPSVDPAMCGTLVILTGVQDADVTAAKRYFLRFNGDEVLEETKYGQILRRAPGEPSRIYVKGLIVATEPNFAFSYNVTSLTKPMLRALNRERTAVGRTAYSDRVKAMLLVSESEAVAEALVADLACLADGTAHDEVKNWTDVGLRASQILNAQRKVVFVTAEELLYNPEMIDRARLDGRDVVAVPGDVAAKLVSVEDVVGQPIQSLQHFAIEWSASVEYKFVSESDLTRKERAVFGLWRSIAALGGGLPPQFRGLEVSETMRPSIAEGMHPVGFWEPATGRVIVHRSQLQSVREFAGTLLHELTHARTGASDVSRAFELGLTEVIGLVTASVIDAGEGQGS